MQRLHVLRDMETIDLTVYNGLDAGKGGKQIHTCVFVICSSASLYYGYVLCIFFIWPLLFSQGFWVFISL